MLNLKLRHSSGLNAIKKIQSAILLNILTRTFLLLIFIHVLAFFISSISFAEGTKQLEPAAGDNGCIQIFDQNTLTRPFASFNCPANNRLNIRICTAGEIIYMGFNQTDNDVHFRLKDPSGTVVTIPGLTPVAPTTNVYLLPSSGMGRITSYTEAINGPSVLTAGGYNAITYSTTVPGDYSVEFNPVSPTVVTAQKRVFTWFDITVATPANVIKNGRVWSKTWDFTTNSGSNQFQAKMFVYSDDGIVTSLDFNGMQPFGFTMSCNATGCTNTGVATADRTSRFGNNTYAQYKIFLNNPDVNCFPTGAFGALTAPPSVTGCGPNKCINFSVSAPGDIIVLLNLNGIAGYQPGTADRQILTTVVAGTNCIPWDTRDGLGNLVGAATIVSVQIDYMNGITHLPLFDVEDNTSGYIVGLVRPTGGSPKLFWDDAAITTGTAPDGLTNLTGCILPTGCHRWNGRGNNSNPETINTWWYANIIDTTINYSVILAGADADIRNPGKGSANDTTVCGLLNPIQLAGGVTSATSGHWTTNGGGSFAPSANGLNPTYTPTATDISGGFVYVKLTTTGTMGACAPASDSIKITFTPPPTANANIDQTVCANNATATLAGSFAHATGAKWSGTGTFVPNTTTMGATYAPTSGQITAGTATLTLTTTGNGICPAGTDQMVITIAASPTANAGPDQTICANNATATLAGAVTNATGKVWSGGAGSFNPNNTTLNAIYTPTAAEITAGTVTLTLTASRAGCISVTDHIIITISPAPTANAGADQSVCHNNPNVTLAGAVTNATGKTWTGGAGTYNPNNTTLNAIYTPTLAERNAGTVTLTLTATKAGCNPVTDPMTIAITPAPTVNAGTDAVVCANKPAAVLSGSVTGATGGTWSGGCGSFAPSINNLSVTYTPCAAEITATLAALVLTTTGNGNCSPVKDTVLVIISPSPTSNAGSDRTVCSNNPSLTLAGAVTNTSSFAWSGGTGTFNPNNATLNALYTPSSAEITAGTATLTLTANRATCNPVTDQMTIVISVAPTANAGADQTVCHNNPAVTLNGSVTVATGGTWSGGGGTFVPNSNTLNATYTPTLAERNTGSVTLTLTTTGNGICNAVNDLMVITITPPPTVNANVDQTVCHNNSDATLNGSVTIATGGTWSGGSGTFAANANTLNAVYTPTLAERNAGTVTLTLTTTGNGNCNAVTDQMVITITPAPTANAGVDRNVCADNPAVVLAGTVTVATGGIWSGGAGTFTPNNSTLNATYNPTVGEISTGSVSLTLTTTGNGICNAVSDLMKITITPAPTVNAGADQTLCGAVTSVPLTGAKTIATGGTWTTNGTGSFSPSATTLNASYIASAADKTAGTVTLTLTTTGNGLCNAVADNLIVSFTSIPSINAGPDKIVCSNDLPIQLNASGSAATWSGGAGSFNPNINALNAIYTPTPGEISAGSVTLTITTTPSGACPTVSDQVIITIPPGPIANAGADQTMCGNLTGAVLNGTITNATSGFWSSNGTGSFVPNATTLNATYNPSALDRTNGSVILTLITVGNGACTGHSDQMSLTIQPAITVNAGPDQTICADLAGFVLSGAVTNATGATWSTGGSGTFTPNNVTLNATYTPSTADRTAGTVTLTLSSTGNGICPVVTDNVVYTITPVPTVNANVDQVVCADVTSISLNGSETVATGGTWTSTGSGTFNNTALLNAVYTPSAADKSSGSVTFTLTTTGNGVCNAVSDQMVLTISTAPTVNAGIDKTVCADIGTVALAGSVTVATGGTWTSSGSGSFNNAALLNAVYTPSAADITGGTVTLTLTSTGNGSCVAVADQMIITITPAPTVNAGLDQNICGNSAATLNGTITVATGAVWSSNGTGSFTPSATSLNAVYHPSTADTASGTVTLTLTTTGNGTCHIYTDQVIISFSDVPLANAGLDQTICADSFNVVLNGKIFNAGGGIWSSGGSGAFFPSATTLNASYVPSVADRSSGSITLTLTSTSNGPCAAVSDQMVITVTPAPTVNAGLDQTICADSAFVNLNGAKTVASGAIWTTSGSGVFAPSNTILNAKYTPSANDKLAGSVTLTLKTTGNGTCKVASDNLVISITPTPNVNAGPDQTICANVPSLVLNGSVTTATGGIWTSNGTGVVGPSNTTLNGTYFTTASDTAAHSVTLTLSTTGNGTCKAVSDQMTLLITRMPIANAGIDKIICAGSPVSVSGQIFNALGATWTSNGSGSFAPNANSLNVTYLPSNADTSAHSVILTLSSTGNGVCTAASDQVVVTINQVPIVNAGADQTLCADADAAQLGGFVANSSGTIWSTNGSGNFSPDANDINALYFPSAADTVNGSIVITLTSIAGTCTPVSDNMTINFTPAPTVNAGPNVSVCAGFGSVALNGRVTVATGVLWSTFGTGTFSPDEFTLNAIYLPSAADETAGSVTLLITTTGNGTCNPVTDNITIAFSVPVIDAGPDQTVCTTNFPVHLQGSGATGQWSGGGGTFSPNNNALNALYTPNAAEIAAGFVVLTITTTGIGTCTPSTDQVRIDIIPGPVTNAGVDTTICKDISSINISGSVTVATGGQWTTSGSGTFGSATSLTTTYTPSLADKNAGIVTLTLTSTGNGTCNGVSDQRILRINPTPTVNAGQDKTVCKDVVGIPLNGSVTIATAGHWTTNGSGNFSDPNILNPVYTPSIADRSGPVILTLTTTTGNGFCNPQSDQMTINFTPTPTSAAGSDQNVCASANNVSLSGGVTIASGGIWTSSGSGVFSPSSSTLNASYTPTAADTTAGSVRLILTTTGNGTCNPVPDTLFISFAPLPIVNAGTDAPLCSSQPGIALSGSVSNATGGTWTSSGTGTFSPSANTLNATYVQSALDNTNGAVNLMLTSTGNAPCSAVSDFTTITIFNVPTASVNAGFDQTICADAGSVTLNGFITVATGGIWSTSGSGTFTPNNTDLNARYIPSAADTTNGTVIITLTTVGSFCAPTSDDMTLTITPAPIADAGGPYTMCADGPGASLSGSVYNATGGQWSTSGSGIFAPSASTLNAVYVPSAADKTAGFVNLTLTTTGNSTCHAVSDNILITITKIPTANAGADKTVCANVASINLTGTLTIATGGTWTTSGSGTFGNANLLTTTYIPSSADTSAKVINLTLTTTTGNGLCNPVSDQVKITFNPAPIVDAGPDQTICAGSNVALNGFVTHATGGRWTTLGSGTFSDVNAVNAVYTPSQADINAGSTSIRYTSIGNGVCNAVNNLMILNIRPAPIVNAGSATICLSSTSGSLLNGAVTNATGGLWSTSGSGVFSPNAAILNAAYFPSIADITAGAVTLTLTSTGNGICSPVSQNTVLTIDPLPIANAGKDQYICRGSSTTLAAQTSANVTYSWTTTTGAFIGATPVVTITTSIDTNFVLTVTDAKGCFKRDTVFVGVYDLPSFALSPQHCLSNSLIVNSNPIALPAVPGIFQWYLNGQILTGQNTSVISPLSTGTYMITYSYGNCSVSASTIVTPPPVLTHRNVITCENGTTAITITSNVSNVNYSWVTGQSGVDLNTINITPVVVDTNFYSATVTDAFGCSSIDSVRIIGIPVPIFAMNDTALCDGKTLILNGRPINIINIDSLNPSYKWLKNSSLLSNTNDSLTISTTGLYKVTLTIGQCSTSDSSNVVFNPVPAAALPDQTKFCKERDNFTILDAGFGIGYTYLWTAPIGITLDSNNTRTVSIKNQGTYSVVVSNIFNCPTNDSVFVRDVCPPRVFVPNAFTPGVPGGDQEFKVFGAYFGNFKMMIFNRWGEIIFISTDRDKGWDGIYRGDLMPVGVYPWVVTYEGDDPELRGPYRLEGSVTVVR